MPTKKNLSNMLTIPQAAKELRITRQAVAYAIKKGRLKVLRFGHVNLIPRSVVKEYKKTRRPGGPSKTK